ncbi:MAG: purine-nucleoside phosphorylase [Bacteroidia bacterium]|nr:purine-nucleoside phosphorylase [Bacteroidota bacterium]MBP6512660.1 purine-nucleoside phosphorylase [Bacteroidia bacterium]MBP7244380.1 purine-nucleoside phosphorylase [Bacteroidia bacterium]
MTSEIIQSSDFLKKFASPQGAIGIIMGTGLHQLAKSIKIREAVDYSMIPHFPTSTVESHKGKLLFGTIEGKEVIAMQGRFHFYEGYSMQQITMPVRVMKQLGVNTLLVSNAAGALNPSYQKGELMLIEDHIHLQSTNPLIGKNDAEMGPRFPDMSAPYDGLLRKAIKKIATENSIRLQEGVYVSVNGPMLETRAEYRYLRTIGADAVGMSTTPEIIVARHMNMRCVGISVLTDVCDPDHLSPVTLEEIIAIAESADPILSKIVSRLIATL